MAKIFARDGLDAVLKLKRNANSDNARRKVDGRMEARIVEIEFEESVSRETILRPLKKPA